MSVGAYARVSTRDQNPQLQLDALAASGYDELVTEKESGKRGVARPAWETLLTLPQAGDTLKFWKSDRWGRSAGHVLTTVNELRDRGITVVSLTENFDLSTKEGRFMFAVLAAAAEYELELRAERQAEGIAAAKRREAHRRHAARKEEDRPAARHRPRRTGHAAPPGRRRRLGHRSRPHPQNRALHRLRSTRATLTSSYPTRIPFPPVCTPRKIILTANGCPPVPQPLRSPRVHAN
ncbi:recombinase family protein [Nonomuraea basaltis]|nr:recombinase family protein [Nonomuraea basaltis]TMR90653.1 recombinase family protein [Nonomuraea basaltis]